MPRQKLDYDKLKRQFMESKHHEVKSFLYAQNVPYNSAVKKYVKGWGKEKKERLAENTDKAIKRAGNKMVKQLEPSTEFLLGNIAKAIELSGRKLEQMEEKDNINVKDLNTIRGMNRIQNGQPTTYVKEEQDVTQKVLGGIYIVLPGKPADNGEVNNSKEI